MVTGQRQIGRRLYIWAVSGFQRLLTVKSQTISM